MNKGPRSRSKKQKSVVKIVVNQSIGRFILADTLSYLFLLLIIA
jgi:hypothetical protein